MSWELISFSIYLMVFVRDVISFSISSIFIITISLFSSSSWFNSETLAASSSWRNLCSASNSSLICLSACSACLYNNNNNNSTPCFIIEEKNNFPHNYWTTINHFLNKCSRKPKRTKHVQTLCYRWCPLLANKVQMVKKYLDVLCC